MSKFFEGTGISFKVNVDLTASKIMSFFLLVAAVYVDKTSESNGSVLMYSIPFIVVLITGKQLNDSWKKKIETKKE